MAGSLSPEQEKKLRAVFVLFDSDGSGTLSVPKLRNVLKRPGSILSDVEIQAMINQLQDHDGDSEMTFEEFAKLWAPMVEAEAEGLADDSEEQGILRRMRMSITRSFNRRASVSLENPDDQMVSDPAGRPARRGSISTIGQALGKTTLRRASLMLQAATATAPSPAISQALGKATLRRASLMLPTLGGKKDPDVALLQSSEVLHRGGVEHQAKAESLKAKAATIGSGDENFEARLGIALLELQLPFKELSKLWDKNSDGDLSMAEVRVGVRALGIAANNAEIDKLFKSFDADHSGKLDLNELKPCIDELRNSAKAAKAQAHAESKRAKICEERAAMFFAAEMTMRAAEVEKERFTQFKRTFGLEERIGFAVRKSKTKLDTLLKQWPGGQVGYVSRQALGEGLKNLNVDETPSHERDLDLWFENCFSEGLAASRCRWDGGINLKYDLHKCLAAAKKQQMVVDQKEAALRDLMQAAHAQQEAIKARARAVAKQWAKEGADALKAAVEKAVASKAADDAKVEARKRRKRDAHACGRGAGSGSEAGHPHGQQDAPTQLFASNPLEQQVAGAAGHGSNAGATRVYNEKMKPMVPVIRH